MSPPTSSCKTRRKSSASPPTGRSIWAPSSLAGVDAALAVAPNFSEQSNLKNDEVQTESPTVVVPVLDSLTSASTIDENLSVKGAAGVGATGAMARSTG